MITLPTVNQHTVTEEEYRNNENIYCVRCCPTSVYYLVFDLQINIISYQNRVQNLAGAGTPEIDAGPKANAEDVL